MADTDIPPVSRGERVTAVIGLIGALIFGLICADVLSGGALSRRITRGECEGCG